MQKQSEHVTHATDRIRLKTSRIHGACGIRNPQVGRNPQALARFQREAQAASALNHPNIYTIHNMGEENGQAFIRMEYMEGKTLIPAPCTARRRFTGHLGASRPMVAPLCALACQSDVRGGTVRAHAGGGSVALAERRSWRGPSLARSRGGSVVPTLSVHRSCGATKTGRR